MPFRLAELWVSLTVRVHQLLDAYNLLQGMLTLGLKPSLQTYTLLLSCCTKARSPYDMGFCHQLVAVTGHPAHLFLLSMPSPGPDGQNVRDHVSNFLDMMQRNCCRFTQNGNSGCFVRLGEPLSDWLIPILRGLDAFVAS